MYFINDNNKIKMEYDLMFLHMVAGVIDNRKPFFMSGFFILNHHLQLPSV